MEATEPPHMPIMMHANAAFSLLWQIKAVTKRTLQAAEEQPTPLGAHVEDGGLVCNTSGGAGEPRAHGVAHMHKCTLGQSRALVAYTGG